MRVILSQLVITTKRTIPPYLSAPATIDQPHNGRRRQHQRKEIPNLREYELVTIFPAGEDSELGAEAVERVSTLVGNHKGEVRAVHHWGKREFAYPIKNTREGFYVLFKLNLSADQVRPLDDSLHIEQNIVRYLLVKDNGGGIGPVIEQKTKAVAPEEQQDE